MSLHRVSFNKRFTCRSVSDIVITVPTVSTSEGDIQAIISPFVTKNVNGYILNSQERSKFNT